MCVCVCVARVCVVCVCECIKQSLTIDRDSKLWPSHSRCNSRQHTATYCKIRQHTATHCNTLQHTASHCNTWLIETRQSRPNSHYNILQLTVTHCNTLQRTATNVYTHTASLNMYQYYWPPVTYRKASPVNTCISILLAVTICTSVLLAAKYQYSYIYISIILALIDYGVATVSRIDKIIGLFGRISPLL